MRKISPNEYFLLILFGGAIFLLGNLFLFRWGKETALGERREAASLRIQLEEYRQWKERAFSIAARREWWEKNPPAHYDSSQSDSAFVEQVQASITSAGLRIEEQRLKPAEKKGAFISIELTLKIAGNLEDLIRWLTAAQKAGNYTEISHFILKSADDNSTMVATMELVQIFVPPNTSNAP